MLLGVDVGGTKTHLRACTVTADGAPDASALDAVVPTSQWRRGGLLEDVDNVRRLVDLLYEGLRTGGFGDTEELTQAALVVGAHGLDSDRQVGEFTEGLAAAHPGPTLAVNDTELLVPASGLDRGIALVAGTGSKVVGHDANGNAIAVGGHGFLTGDPGSAPQLVLAAVKAALIAYDERQFDEPLLTLLGDHFGCTSAVDLAEHFNRQADMLGWASAAPLVFKAADNGSRAAMAVIGDAAVQLAADVARAVDRGAVGNEVVCAGGVITHQPRLVHALRQALADRRLHLEVRLLAAPPVDGAVALAAALLAGKATSDASGGLLLAAHSD